MAVGRAGFLLLLAIVSIAAVQAANEAAPMFTDWLAQQSGVKVRSANYEEVETESACLEQVAQRNCRCFHLAEINGVDVCPHEYVETKMTCCKDPRYSAQKLLSEITSVGVCSYSQEYFDTAIPYDGTDTTKIGIFSVTCELREDADSCGGPLCEGMSLTAQGDILRYPNVAYIGLPSDMTADEDCTRIPDNPLRQRSPNAKKVTNTPQPAPAGAATPAPAGTPNPAKLAQYEGEDGEGEGYYHGKEGYEVADGPKYYLGQGDIFCGTFWVTSRHKKVPYKTGQYQLVYPSNIPNMDGIPLDAPPAKSYVARGNAVVLEFYKSGSY